MSVLLEVSGLTTGFQQKNKTLLSAIDNVSFSIEAGEVLGVVGESGCGKSVTALSILQLLGKNGRIQQGAIRLHGRDLVHLSEPELRKIRGNDIAMIFQEPMTSLNPVHTIGQHIAEPLRIHLGLGKREARERVLALLNLVGIARAGEIIDEFPHRLSGGMRQRVMIAIAIACHPKLLIADEPTTALDVTIQAQILDLLRDIKDEHGMGVLLITHDLGVVAEMCRRVVVMYAGRVVEEGPVEQIFNHPSHPYTIGLLNSLPHIGERKNRLYSIPGTVPSLGQMPQGCRFSTRCPHVEARCQMETPPFVNLSSGHRTACWNPQGTFVGEKEMHV